MPPVARIAYVIEDEDFGPPGDPSLWLTGRFSGGVVDDAGGREVFTALPLDEALAWARVRTDRVLVRCGEAPDVHFSAGATEVLDAPAWPPPGLPPLIRRRHPADRWRDRTEADAPITWRVEVRLLPPDADAEPVDELVRRRDDWLAIVAETAAAAGAEGWDAEPLDQFVADLSAAQERAGGAATFGWMTTGAVALRLWLTVEAPTAQAACVEATWRLETPENWGAELEARPIDAEEGH
jgi:hypothetical protein